MPGSEGFFGDKALRAASSLPISGLLRRPAMICKFIAVGISCGARGDDGGGLARGGPYGLVPAMDAAAACCEDWREKDGDMPTGLTSRSTQRLQGLLLYMQHGAPCSVMCFFARSGIVSAHLRQYVCELKAQGMNGNIGALLVLIHLHQFSQDVFKPVKISTDGYDNLALHHILLEIYESCVGPSIKAACCLHLNWIYLRSVNRVNKDGIIGGTIQQSFFVHTQGYAIRGSAKDSIKYGYSSRTLVLLQHQCWWRPCAPGLVSTSSSYEIHRYLSGCHTLYSVQVALHDEYAFLLFGTCRRRVRASLLRFLRFNGQEPPGLSSVMDHLYLQLIPLPHRHLLTRLLVEPLALRLARVQEALEEYDYRCVESEFSTDPLAGSGCTLQHMHLCFPAVFFLCVCLGNSAHQGECCTLCVVISVL